MARLRGICRSNSISFTSKFKLYKSLVISILLYRCETWTVLADPQKKMQAFEAKCLRKFIRIFYLEHKPYDGVRREINFLVGPKESLPATVKRWKLTCFGHVTHNYSLSKTILQGTLEDGRGCYRQRKCWMDIIKEWTSPPMSKLLTTASRR